MLLHLILNFSLIKLEIDDIIHTRYIVVYDIKLGSKWE